MGGKEEKEKSFGKESLILGKKSFFSSQDFFLLFFLYLSNCPYVPFVIFLSNLIVRYYLVQSIQKHYFFHYKRNGNNYFVRTQE